MRCLNPPCGRDGISVSAVVCPYCGIHLPTLLRDVLPAGTQLRGDKAYRVDYALGRGGFGITYQAVNTYFNEIVAIKEFYPQEHARRDGATGSLSVPATQQASYQRGMQRFIREGRILRGINHPNVVQVKDLFEERGTAYLVMELITGRTLQDELKAQPGGILPKGLVRKVMEQLVGALEAVHKENVYHLDLKPENVLITLEERVVLVDFGAARQGFSSRTTQAFTPDYAALEVIVGEDVGAESDVFELGMILYEMLTGERPAPALKRLRKDTWEPKGIEEPWKSLVIEALRLQKEDRPKSVQAWWEGKMGKTVPKISTAPPAPKISDSDEMIEMIEKAMGTTPSGKGSDTETKRAGDSRPLSKSGEEEMMEQIRRLLG